MTTYLVNVGTRRIVYLFSQWVRERRRKRKRKRRGRGGSFYSWIFDFLSLFLFYSPSLLFISLETLHSPPLSLSLSTDGRSISPFNSLSPSLLLFFLSFLSLISLSLSSSHYSLHSPHLDFSSHLSLLAISFYLHLLHVFTPLNVLYSWRHHLLKHTYK